MIKEIVDISTYEYLSNLEKTYYEQQSYSNIIMYMLAQNMYSNPGFNYYQEEYIKKMKAFEFERSRFEKNIIEPIKLIMNIEDIGWEIDFITKEVTLSDKI